MPRPPNPVPVRSQGRDEQAARRRSKTYGALDADPDQPLEGYTWVRADLSPPQLRVKIGGEVWKVDFSST